MESSNAIQVQLSQELVGLIDPVDTDLLNGKWYPCYDQLRVRAYVVVNIKHKHTRVHRLILSRILGRDLLPTEVVDHANGNTLDNRRCNLRLASNAENLRNRKKPSNNTSGYKGVSFDYGSMKWQARIMANGTSYDLGRFNAPEDAAQAYDEAAINLHGEFASTNKIHIDE